MASHSKYDGAIYQRLGVLLRDQPRAQEGTSAFLQYYWEDFAKTSKLLEIPAFRDFKMMTPETTPESMRAMGQGRPKSALVPGVTEKDIQIPVRDGASNPARVYSPEGASGAGKPLLVMAFGGGYVLGNLESEETNCRKWVTNHGGIAVSISYRYEVLLAVVKGNLLT